MLSSCPPLRELQDKSEHLLRVKKEKASVLSDLETKLAAREQEVRTPTCCTCSDNNIECA